MPRFSAHRKDPPSHCSPVTGAPCAPRTSRRPAGRHCNGLTLIELLCVIAIIGILASLLLGPASRALKRARDADWADKVGMKIERVVESLRAYHSRNDVTDRLTPQQLFANKVIDELQLQFLEDRRVQYTPFNSHDASDLVVIRVEIAASFLNGHHVELVRKGRIVEKSDDKPGK